MKPGITATMLDKLVVDANMLLAALRGGRTLERIERLQAAEVVLYVPEPMKLEVDKHLPRLIERSFQARGASATELEEHLSNARGVWTRMQTAMIVTSTEAYQPFEEMARRRVPHDPDDWPCVALALALGASIFTDNVRHLGRSGIGVWDSSTVDVLIEELEETLERQKTEGQKNPE